VKELFNVSDAGAKIIQLRLHLGLHVIETAFDRCQPLVSRGDLIVFLLWYQATDEMVLLRMIPRTSFKIGDALCVACVAYEEII